jgi:hypothetical protein
MVHEGRFGHQGGEERTEDIPDTGWGWRELAGEVSIHYNLLRPGLICTVLYYIRVNWTWLTLRLSREYSTAFCYPASTVCYSSCYHICRVSTATLPCSLFLSSLLIQTLSLPSNNPTLLGFYLFLVSSLLQSFHLSSDVIELKLSFLAISSLLHRFRTKYVSTSAELLSSYVLISLWTKFLTLRVLADINFMFPCSTINCGQLKVIKTSNLQKLKSNWLVCACAEFHWNEMRSWDSLETQEGIVE